MNNRSLTRNIKTHFPIHIIAAYENMCKYLLHVLRSKQGYVALPC